MATDLYHNGIAKQTVIVSRTRDPKTGEEKIKTEDRQIILPEGAMFGGRPVRKVVTVKDPEEAKALRAKGFTDPPKNVTDETEAPKTVKSAKKGKE